jgi:protein arginine kinase activator
MSQTNCDLCGGQHATVRFTEIDDGRVTKRTICRACAQSRGLLDEPSKPLAVVEMLLAQATAMPPAPSEPAPAADRTCGACGHTFAAFRRQHRLGCPQCYVAFAPLLLPLLRKIHPRVRHVGKAPRVFARKAELRQRLDDLRAELDRAVRAEDYERAAQLRDDIRAALQEQTRAAQSGDAPEAGK